MSSISAGTTTTTGYVVSSDTTGALVLKTGASGTTALTIDTSQNVGIGTSSPAAKLEVNGAVVPLRLDSISTLPSNQNACYVGPISEAAGGGVNGDLALIPRTSTTGSIVFATGSTTPSIRMKLDSSGNLGIGNTSPAVKLDVVGGTLYDGNFYLTSQFRNVATAAEKGILLGYNNADTSSILAPGYANGTGALAFWTQNGSTWGERARIDSSGNLGVGTTSPASYAKAAFVNASGTALYAGGGTQGVFITGDNSTRYVTYNASGSFAGGHIWQNGNTEVARIDLSGNFTLGFAASPYNSAKMEIYRASAGDALILTSPVGTGNSNALAWSNSRGDVVSARIYNVDDGYYGASIVFANRTGPGTTTTERARIDSSGNFMVGTATAISKMTLSGGKFVINSTDSGYGQIQIGNTTNGGEASIAFVSGATGFNDPTSVNGNTYVWAIGAGVYSIGGNNWGIGNKGVGNYVAKIAYNSTSWTFSSDERLKDLDGEITNAVEKVAGLRAVYYTWKSDESKTRKVGLIAQDVLAVLPEAVDKPEQGTKEDGTPNYLGLGMSDVVPLLVAAIKEQQALIESLTQRIAALEGTS